MIRKAEKYVKGIMDSDTSGHDFYHTLRVRNLAMYIAREEAKGQSVDLYAVELMALLHDADDRKLSPETCATLGKATKFLEDNGIDEGQKNLILQGIRQISFKGTDSEVPDSIEGRCVQDADRLDAIGAVGIARAFAFGGSRARAMYDPEVPPRYDMDAASYAANKGHTINHFYEKLLLLKDMMNTDAGKRIALQRHEYMEGFLAEFYAEWDGLK